MPPRGSVQMQQQPKSQADDDDADIAEGKEIEDEDGDEDSMYPAAAASSPGKKPLGNRMAQAGVTTLH